jgi:transcriptional regulator with XRE-family HTH domain
MIRGKLIAARERRGWTQEYVAERVSVDVATIRRWERGEASPQGRHKHKLMMVFEVEDERLLDLGDRRQTRENIDNIALSLLARQGLAVRLMAMVGTASTAASSKDVIELDLYIKRELGQAMQNEVTRREAILMLMGLPQALYHVSASNVVEDPAEAIVRQCAAGISACSQLGKGSANDLLLASQTLSSYLPSLKALVKHSSKHRAAAASLVAQALIQKAGLAIHIHDSKLAVKCAEQAMPYAQASKNKILEVAAASRLTWVLFGNDQYHTAMQQALYTVSLLEEASQAKALVPTLMQSAVYGDAALYQAVSGYKEEALAALGRARDTFDPAKEDGPNYLAWSEDILTLFEGRTRYFNGDARAAYTIIAQVIDPETFEPKMPHFTKDTKPQAINFLTQASLKLPTKDKELSVKLWKAGLQSTLETQSEQRFGEVQTSLDIMEAVWAGEPDIAGLRQTMKHW